MATLWDWQNSSSVVRIQNKNYVADAIKKFWSDWDSYRGCMPDILANGGIGIYTPIDSTVRIPGGMSGNYNQDYAISTGVDAGVRGGDVMLGTYNYGTNYGKIMDYMPRLYVELMPLSDYINNIATPAGITKYWAKKYTFGFYDAPTGVTYQQLDSSYLSAPLSGLYVLTKYELYTNTPGTTQSKLNTYTYSTSTNYFRDTFIPLDTGGTNGRAPWQGYATYPMIPYVRSFATLLYNYNSTVSTFIGLNNAVIGEAGGLGSTNGISFTGVNQIWGTVDGTFSDNPAMYTVKYMDAPNWTQLTTFPVGNSTKMIVADLKTWKKIFNGSGMPWSDVLADVISPDDGNLNKPTIPGTPTNPTGGGDGDGDNISDDIPLPDVTFFPNSNAYNRYWLKSSDLTALQNWIFGETFLNDIRRLWNDPAEYLINISYYPFNGYLHDVNNVSPANISIGNLTSDISAFAMGDGYSAKFRGGTLAVNEYYGTYMDYAPYTSAEIYIPYIGYRQLNINDIMGKTIELIYAVDWDTNQLTATILVDDRPLTMFSGAFGVKLALSGTNANQVAETITQGIIGTVTTAGMAVAAGVTGNVVGAVAGGVKAAEGALNTLFNVQNSPRQFGTPTPSTGVYNTQIPHLIIHRPISAEPSDYKTLKGYPAGYSGKVSEFSGYLQCSSVKLPSAGTMTDGEMNEINRLLTGGIFI